MMPSQNIGKLQDAIADIPISRSLRTSRPNTRARKPGIRKSSLAPPNNPEKWMVEFVAAKVERLEMAPTLPLLHTRQK